MRTQKSAFLVTAIDDCVVGGPWMMLLEAAYELWVRLSHHKAGGLLFWKLPGEIPLVQECPDYADTLP